MSSVRVSMVLLSLAEKCDELLVKGETELVKPVFRTPF